MRLMFCIWIAIVMHFIMPIMLKGFGTGHRLNILSLTQRYYERRDYGILVVVF
jgi:hypothetical protein